MTINVLCYGDSNTWGYVPGKGERYDYNTRWTGIMGNKLGGEYRIIEEGLNGRTTVFEDPFTVGYNRSGKGYLGTCLMTHKPLDIILIMLGSNDLKAVYNADAFEIAKGINSLIQIIRGLPCGGSADKSPEIRIISPPDLGELSDFAAQFSGFADKIKRLPVEYEKVAKENNVLYFNATQIVKGSSLDGVHLDEKGHKKLGEALAKWIIC